MNLKPYDKSISCNFSDTVLQLRILNKYKLHICLFFREKLLLIPNKTHDVNEKQILYYRESLNDVLKKIDNEYIGKFYDKFTSLLDISYSVYGMYIETLYSTNVTISKITG